MNVQSPVISRILCVCVCVCACARVCNVSVNNDNLVGEITSKSQDKAHAARAK